MSDSIETVDPRDLAFIEPDPIVAGLKLRPFSVATLTICRALKLTLALGGAELTEEEKQQQMVVLLFIQSQPIDVVKRAVKHAQADYQAFLDDYIFPFEFGLEVVALPQMFAELEAVFSAANISNFGVKSESGPTVPN